MYNDENNLYHYTYPRDSGGETQGPSVDDQLRSYQSGRTNRQEPSAELKPAKKKHAAVKIVALALVCALAGGAAGAGITTAMNGGRGNSTINMSDSQRPSPTAPTTQVTLNTTTGKPLLSDQEVYAQNVNSVVSINVKGTSGYNYFGQKVETASAGSGFILTKDGYIVTNYHVIKGANTVKVTLYNNETYDAEVVGGDEDYDIAVIKITAENLQPVTLGSSDVLNVGDRVLAVGNPLGELTFSMTGGMVSCVNRTINVDGTPFNMIQTDASINPGNSGGPLLNSYGEVVGIVSAKYSSYSTEAVEGLGFAIPINDVISMIEDIMTNGYVSDKAYLGATIGTLTEQMKEQYRYDIDSGAFIYSVDGGGAADKAGLKMGDVITKIDGTKIATLEDLTAAKKKFSAGDTSTLTVYREGQTITVQLTWDAQPKEERDASTGATPNQGGNGYYGSDDMEDLFNWFFGNRYR